MPYTAAQCTEVIERVDRDIMEAREEAQHKDNERHGRLAELVSNCTAISKAKQDALQLQLDNRAWEFRHARLNIETDFQHKFLEHSRCWEVLQKRQAEELRELERGRDSSLATVEEVYLGAEAELAEEHRKADEWWQHLCDTTTAGLQQIEEDEKRELQQTEIPGWTARVAILDAIPAATLCSDIVAPTPDDKGVPQSSVEGSLLSPVDQLSASAPKLVATAELSVQCISADSLLSHGDQAHSSSEGLPLQWHHEHASPNLAIFSSSDSDVSDFVEV